MKSVIYNDQTDKQILEGAQSFLRQTLVILDTKQFKLDSHWHIDHLCYRTSSEDNYLDIKQIFSRFSRLLTESEVNGRMISTFKLHAPITVEHWTVDLIEVPAPKKGKITEEGFEHFEVVCDLPFEELMTRYQNFPFNKGGLAKELNQELEFVFEEFAIKFHHLSLESVINLEINQQAIKVLKESRVLKALQDYGPLIAGTFPLGLNVVGSDLDVMVSTSNLYVLADVLTEEFSRFENFELFKETIDGEPAVRAYFVIQNIPIEIIGQMKPSVRQSAYLHFLAEERILKLKPTLFLEQVQAARAQGLKTEPAFARALKISGDPYKELLRLQGMSNAELSLL